MNKKKTYYKIKPKSILNIEFNILKEKIPKGESGVFSINIFKNDYFYSCSSGLIGFPTSQLYENYSFFIFNDLNNKSTFKNRKDEFIKYISNIDISKIKIKDFMKSFAPK